MSSSENNETLDFDPANISTYNIRANIASILQLPNCSERRISFTMTRNQMDNMEQNGIQEQYTTSWKIQKIQ